MNKSELVDSIANAAGKTKAEANRFLDLFIETVTDALKAGSQVVMPGFGSFSTMNRAPRTGRNPQTGETIQIKGSRIAKFKAGKKLKEAVEE